MVAITLERVGFGFTERARWREVTDSLFLLKYSLLYFRCVATANAPEEGHEWAVASDGCDERDSRDKKEDVTNNMAGRESGAHYIKCCRCNDTKCSFLRAHVSLNPHG